MARGAPVPAPGALAPGFAQPGRGKGAPGPTARGSRETPPALREVATAAAGRPDLDRPGPRTASPAALSPLPAPSGPPGPRRAPGSQPAAKRSHPAGAPIQSRPLPPAGLRRLPPAPPPPPARTPARQRHPAASRNLTPSFASCGPPRPAANFLHPTSVRASRPDGPAGREGWPRRAAGPPQVQPTARGVGSTLRTRSADAPARGSVQHTPPPPRPVPTPRVHGHSDGGRRRRGRGRQGDVSLAARPAPAPASAPRRPSPRAAATAAGPGQVSYLQRETREGEREGRSRRRRRRRRETGKEETAEPPPKSRFRAAAGAATSTPPAPSAVRSGRSLAACARVESWHFLPRSWRTAPSARIAASCLPHPGQPFIESPLPIGPRPATLPVAGQSERGKPRRCGGHWAERRVSASANGRGEELRGVAGAGPWRGGAERRDARAGAGAGRGRNAQPKGGGGAGRPRPLRALGPACSHCQGAGSDPAGPGRFESRRRCACAPEPLQAEVAVGVTLSRVAQHRNSREKCFI